MASDKTPGTDGLPAEFYKVFWEDIEGYLLNALNGACEKRCQKVFHILQRSNFVESHANRVS